MASGYAVVVYTCVILLPTTLCQQGTQMSGLNTSLTSYCKIFSVPNENSYCETFIGVSIVNMISSCRTRKIRFLYRTCFCETDGYKHTCDFTRLFCSPHDNNCNKENVALGKTVVVSTGYRVNKDATAVGCMANDGITSNAFAHYSRPEANCYHSGEFDYEPAWEVFLGRNYSISEITIYGRESFATRMLNVIVSVDNNDCYHFPVGKNASGIRDRTDIVCTPVLRGSRVKLRKPHPGEKILIYFYLNICELQVWVCKEGLYGAKCDSTCNAPCKNCDNYDGSCRDGCEPGYWGIYCQTRCGNCRELGCAQLSGKCLKGCEKGWRGDKCAQVCAAGFHGYDCAQKCGTCSGGQVCSRITGLCAAGCDDGWRGAACSETCTPGTWGPACKNKCANCATGTVCDSVNGNCPQGCTEGFRDFKCTEACNAGTYGPNCEKACGGCKKSTTCDSKSGVCSGGCDHGWMSEFCTQQCPLTSYGEDCKLNCSNCDEGQACDRVTGECHEGCKSGWHSAFCNESCPTGTYGQNCSEECSQCKNNNCSNEKGACQDGCDPGYTGTYCKELEKAEAQSDKLPLGIIVGVAIGGCALLMLIIAIIMLRAARNRLESENEELQGLKKSDEVEITQQIPLHADGIVFQGGSKDDQTATPQPESPAAIEEIKVSDEKLPAEGQSVQEKPKLPIRDASQDESGDTRGTISKGSAEETESEDE